MLLKPPPAKTVLSSASTLRNLTAARLGVGRKVVRTSPVAVLTAASRLKDVRPSMPPNRPPTNRSEPSTASERTSGVSPVVLALQVSTTAPVVAFTAARFARGVPLTVVNLPPRKMVPPSPETAIALTTPLVLATNPVSSLPSLVAPGATLIAAMPPRG